MNPIASHYVAKARMEDLHREAEQYRRANQLRSAIGVSTRIRTAVGSRLISIGERLLPGPVSGRSVPSH